MDPQSRALTALLALAFLAGCVAPVQEPPSPPPVARPAPAPAKPPPSGGAPEIRPVPEPPAPPAPPEPIPPPPPPPSSGATAALLEQGRQQAANGRYDLATASLERALRINSRDAEVWCELGRIKRQQGDEAQAIAMARRGLAVAGANAAARERCQSLLTGSE